MLTAVAVAGKQVALVGTDIEGSTALYEWSQDIMQEAQDIHDNLLRAEMRYGWLGVLQMLGFATVVAHADSLHVQRLLWL